MKKRKCILYTMIFSVLIAAAVLLPVRAEESGAPDWPEMTFSDFDVTQIQMFLDKLPDGAAEGMSFAEIMKMLVNGDLPELLSRAAGGLRQALFSEIRTNSGLMGQVVLLAFTGAIFSSFTGIFGSGHVSETGFYVLYLLTITFLAASFFASIRVADAVFHDIMEFMRALLPAWFLAVAMAGGAITSSAMCGFTIASIGLVQSIFSGLLVPLMRVYMMLVLAGNLYREDMISRMTGLLKMFIEWTVKALFGVVVGFHVIQGMVLPQADALKNASVMRVAQMIPGLGSGAGAVSQMVMGSGILIKNTAGAFWRDDRASVRFYECCLVCGVMIWNGLLNGSAVWPFTSFL